MTKFKVVKLLMISPACPTQWEGDTDSGEQVYIRYRWGELDWEVGEDGGSVRVGGPLSGMMSEVSMKKHLSDVLEFDCVETIQEGEQ